MAVANWLARALATSRVYTFTAGGTWVAADTAWVEINGKRVTFVATTTTATHMITGLLAELAASTIPEFLAVTWTSPTSTTIVGTGMAGIKFIADGDRTTAGSGAFSEALTTAGSGPNHWSDTVNWDTATVPITGDTVNANLALGSILFDIDQNAVTLAALNIFSPAETQNTLGLPKTNAGGWTEYLDRALKIGATNWRADSGSPLVSLNFGSVENHGEVIRTGTSSSESGVPALMVQGTSGANTLDVVTGTVGCAFYDGESYNAASATVAQQASLITGTGSVIADTVSTGTTLFQGTGTNFETENGQAEIRGTPGFATLVCAGGQTIAKFGGEIADVVVGPGTLDASLDNTPRTFTNCTLRPGANINDPNETIVYGNITKEPGVSTLSAA